MCLARASMRRAASMPSLFSCLSILRPVPRVVGRALDGRPFGLLRRTCLLAALTLSASPAPAQVPDSSLWIADDVVRVVVRDSNTIYIGGDFTRVGPLTGGGVPLNVTHGDPVRPFPNVN